jgi:putative ABC transport system permease protein
MALGSPGAQVLRLIVGEGMAVVALGVGVGVVGALALSRVLTSLVFDVSVRDPLTYVVVAASLAAVALVACVLPARKAARTDPLVALRSE